MLKFISIMKFSFIFELFFPRENSKFEIVFPKLVSLVTISFYVTEPVLEQEMGRWLKKKTYKKFVWKRNSKISNCQLCKEVSRYTKNDDDDFKKTSHKFLTNFKICEFLTNFWKMTMKKMLQFFPFPFFGSLNLENRWCKKKSQKKI